MFLAIRDLRYNKARYSLITVMLTLLIFMVLFLAGLANGLSSATSASIKNAAADYYILSDDADSIITRSNITVDQFNEVSEKAKVELTPVNLMRMNIKKSDDDKKIDITYMAIDKNSFMMPEILEGEDTSEDVNTILLNNSFIDEGVSIGDTIVDATSGIELKVVGFVEDEMFSHSPIGIISRETFEGIRKEIDKNYQTLYNAIAVNGEDVDNLKVDGLTVVSKNDIIKNIPGYSQEQMSINMILLVLLVVSAFILGVFFYIITIQKLMEFGVMKALGMQMRSLCSMLISQVIILSGISMVIGNVLTFSISRLLPSSMPFLLERSSSAIISIMFILISIIISLVSLVKIAKVDPLITIGGRE